MRTLNDKTFIDGKSGIIFEHNTQKYILFKKVEKVNVLKYFEFIIENSIFSK